MAHIPVETLTARLAEARREINSIIENAPTSPTNGSQKLFSCGQIARLSALSRETLALSILINNAETVLAADVMDLLSPLCEQRPEGEGN